MKEFAVVFWGLLQMAGCSVGKPPVSEIATIEALTARDPCVGELSRWHREFHYQKANFGVDKDDISVSYVEAGHRGKKAGRYIIEPPIGWFSDHAQYAFARGTWDRDSGRLKEWGCGCSWGASSSTAGPPVCTPLGS